MTKAQLFSKASKLTTIAIQAFRKAPTTLNRQALAEALDAYESIFSAETPTQVEYARKRIGIAAESVSRASAR